MKIELRRLFGPEMNLGWDDSLPKELHESWVRILAMFVSMEEIIVSRAFRPVGAYDGPEVTGYAD